MKILNVIEFGALPNLGWALIEIMASRNQILNTLTLGNDSAILFALVCSKLQWSFVNVISHLRPLELLAPLEFRALAYCAYTVVRCWEINSAPPDRADLLAGFNVPPSKEREGRKDGRKGKGGRGEWSVGKGRERRGRERKEGKISSKRSPSSKFVTTPLFPVIVANFVSWTSLSERSKVFLKPS